MSKNSAVLPSESKPGLIVLFGSGEMSPTGRKIHEIVLSQTHAQIPVRVGILETPTGYEVNARTGWPERMERFIYESLPNWKPVVTRIHALRRDGAHSTNTPAVVSAIAEQHYLYCGAGSPSYAIFHLQNSRAYELLRTAHKKGMTLSIGSATAIALSAYALPVYEIFKVGSDLHWIPGLNFFAEFGLNLAIIPHWNNLEGEYFDTTHCFMGVERFNTLVGLLPRSVTIVGIDEQTAGIIDVAGHTVDVVGVGSVHILKNGKEKTYQTGSSFGIEALRQAI